MPLGGIHYLDHPIGIGEFERLRPEVLGIRAQLEARHGKPTYYPFNGYGEKNIRAAQAYLTKMPRALVGLLSARYKIELDAQGDVLTETPGSTDKRSGGQGFMRDTARKLAIEKHAVARAVEHYQALGATEIEILGKPYDIRLKIDGEEVHVEVKGSGNELTDVLVTRNEVEHARAFPRTELVVVDVVEWHRKENGEIGTAGGRLRRWPVWSPTDASLRAMTYSHSLPIR
jgi:hypothetical protein